MRQVEELKALVKVLPIWSGGIYIAATTQQSFWINQAHHMNRHLTPHFQIPEGSFAVFLLLSLTIGVALYDRIIVPFLSKRNPKRQQPGLSFKLRMGIGLAISCLSTSVAAIVEKNRRKQALVNGETMSALWLVPQYSLVGLAEAFNAIGQIEFYYSQFPKSMASIAVALFTVGMGFGNLVGAILVNIVDDCTNNYNGTNVSWLPDDPNQGRYDYYFWVLTLLGLGNLLYYFLCSRTYGSCEERNIWDEEEEEEKKQEEQAMSKSTESAVFAA